MAQCLFDRRRTPASAYPSAALRSIPAIPVAAVDAGRFAAGPGRVVDAAALAFLNEAFDVTLRNG